MGSGHFDNGVYQRTCFMSQVELVDHNFGLVDSPTGVQTAMSRCYLEGDESYKNDGKTGYSFCFAGTNIGVISAKDPPKVKLESFSQL